MNRRKRDQELKEELESHLCMAAQDRIDRGEAAGEALAGAKRELGNVALIEEVTRETWGGANLRRFMQDVRYAIRVLRRNPIFAAVSVLTLALGVAACTAIFSVVYGVLLRPLPYEKPADIVQVWELSDKGHRMRFADANFADMRSESHSFEGLAEFDEGIDSVIGSSEPARINAAYVSHDFFQVMGIRPAIGRTFLPEEEQPHGRSVALVSYSYWRQSLGSPRDLGSISMKVENKPTVVVGVLPPGFHFPGDTQIWLSIDTTEKPTSRTAHNYHVIGRIRGGLEQAHTELNGIAQRIKQQYGQDVSLVATDVVPLRKALTESTRLSLLVLMGVSGLLLFVACSNVTNLMLAQATARQTELAVRSALGASRLRLIRQFFAESLVLCMVGGAAGVGLSFVGVRVLLALAPRNIPRLEEVSVNFPVLLFALAASTGVAVALGILTAVRVTSSDVQSKLTEAGRGQGTSIAGKRAGQVIVMAQMAVTALLLVGAGLLGRSFLRILSVDPGFRTEHVLTIDLALPETGDQKMQRIELISKILDGLRNLPGVEEGGGTADLPLAPGYGDDGVFALVNPQQLSRAQQELIQRSAVFKGEPGPQEFKALNDFFDPLFHDKAHTGQAEFIVASEDYFRTLGIPLRRGRLFTEADTIDAPHVALISQSLARKVWPDRDPIGESIEFGNMDGDLRLLRIVGIVGDVRGSSLEMPPQPTVYVSYRQRPARTSSFSVVLLTRADPSLLIAAARRTIAEADPTVPVKFSTFENLLSSSVSIRRFNLTVVVVFSATALLLAIAGIYGVLAFSVERRTHEIGVRIALGASSSNVLKLVLQQAAIIASIGVLIGGTAGFLLTRLMRSMLFGISNSDPQTYMAVAAILIVVALLAAYVPARRATTIDPMTALRSE